MNVGITKEVRRKRLQREVQERVIMNDGNLHKSFQEVLDHLYKTHERREEQDRTYFGEVLRDIDLLKEMIKKYNEIV